MDCVAEAFNLISDDLNEHELAGKYLFRVILCGVNDSILTTSRVPYMDDRHAESSPLRQK